MERELESLQMLYLQKKMVLTADTQLVKKEGEDHLKKIKDANFKTVITFLAVAAAIWYVDHVSAAKLVTSAPGFWILVGCALYYAASRLYLLQQLNAILPTQSTLNLMEQLKSYKKLNNFFATYGEVLYVMILSIGVYLYLIPILLYMTNSTPLKYIQLLKLIWLIYIGWVMLHIFYFKRKQLKAETAVINHYLLLLKTTK